MSTVLKELFFLGDDVSERSEKTCLSANYVGIPHTQLHRHGGWFVSTRTAVSVLEAFVGKVPNNVAGRPHSRSSFVPCQTQYPPSGRSYIDEICLAADIINVEVFLKALKKPGKRGAGALWRAGM